MLLGAADVDPVAAVGKHVLHAFLRLHQLALLVDDDAGQGSGSSDSAAFRLDLAGQQLEQGRLSSPVGTDDADAVAALNTKREIADNRPFSVALADLVRLDHGLRADVILGQRQFRRPGRAEHRRALGAHFVQLGKPALVAAAPCRHAALQPVQLELEFGVEFFGCSCLLIVDAFGPRLEPAETDLGAPELPSVEPDATLRQERQESAVVADRDKCAGKALQPFLQPFDRAEVEMVGRLVEQQHVWFLRQRARDRCAPPLAPTGRRGRTREIDPKLVGNRGSFVRFRCVATI